MFRDGLQSTYDKAKRLKIPVVSVLWLEACKKHMRLADPKDFAIFNAHRYDYPEQYPKLKVIILRRRIALYQYRITFQFSLTEIQRNTAVRRERSSTLFVIFSSNTEES